MNLTYHKQMIQQISVKYKGRSYVYNTSACWYCQVSYKLVICPTHGYKTYTIWMMDAVHTPKVPCGRWRHPPNVPCGRWRHPPKVPCGRWTLCTCQRRGAEDGLCANNHKISQYGVHTYIPNTDVSGNRC
jgi:hypothetical protein